MVSELLRPATMPHCTGGPWIAEIETIYRGYQVLLFERTEASCELELELRVQLHATRRLRGHRLAEKR